MCLFQFTLLIYNTVDTQMFIVLSQELYLRKDLKEIREIIDCMHLRGSCFEKGSNKRKLKERLDGGRL